MRLFILGATGNTGTQIVDLALSRGHEVTAFVRSPDKIKRRHPLLRVLPGDPHDVDELASALPGHDAVISALGVRPPADTAATDIKELTLRPQLGVRPSAAARAG